MRIRCETIRGYDVDDELLCANCVTTEERDAAKSSDIVTDDMVDGDDELFFCDRCEEQL